MNKAQKFWDEQAKRFDDSDKKFTDANQLLIAKTKEYLSPADNVLDFGCATGAKTFKLADKVKHIHGLDYSAEMIKKAINRKNESNVMNVSFSQGTIFTCDFEKASFDKIIAYSVVHLLDDSGMVIQRIHDLLKPGGLFISETACFKEKMDFKTRLQVTTFLFLHRTGIFPLHLSMFKTSELEHLIRSKNFRIIRSENLFYNGMTISFIAAEKSR